MNARPIYLDYMATTPVDSRVIDAMVNCLGVDGHYGNPSSSTHVYGKAAAQVVATAREQVAAAVHASPEEIIFTSGATEADNLAILGAASFYKSKGKHLITMTTEHKAVLDSFQQLEKQGFEVTYLSPKSDGLLDLEQLAQTLRADTILVSVMHVNNEIGVIQDIAAIGEMLKGKGVIFHVDAAQSAGKLPIDLSVLSVDLMSFSAHKLYGPKGVGALFIKRRPRIRLQPLSFGGGQENGLRAGTLATHQIVGMGEAMMLAEGHRIDEQQRILNFRHMLWNGIKHLPKVRMNGHWEQRIAGNLNICFQGLDGDSILLALHELAISTASACASASLQPSYVLKELGLDDEAAYSSLRLSIGRFTSEQDIAKAITIVCSQINRLYEMSP